MARLPARPVENPEVLAVDVIEDGGDWSALPDIDALIIEAARAAAAEVSPRVAHRVAIALSCDADIAELNGRFRAKLKPTNVLSFPASKGAEPGFLGDVVLAQETIAREAAAQGTSLAHHIQHLVVHGVLHLYGYDHEHDADAEKMESTEIAILSKLGIANPYTDAPEPDTKSV